MRKIKIKYTGEYPNLCSGKLTVYVGKRKWNFGEYCLSTGGRVWFDKECNEHVEHGEWTITKYPKKFPKELKNKVEELVNNQIPYGCCGGCI